MFGYLEVDLLRLGVAADAFPQAWPIIQIIRNNRAVLLGRLHSFDDNLGRGVAERGENPARVKPARTVFAKNFLPIDVAFFQLRGCGVATIGHAFRAANAKTALGEVQPIANRATDAVVIAPLEVVHGHTALQNKILHQPPHFIICEGRNHRRAQAEASPQAACHVVLAAAFPRGKLPRRANTTLAGIQSQHNFPQRNKIVPALIGGFNFENRHCEGATLQKKRAKINP